MKNLIPRSAILSLCVTAFGAVSAIAGTLADRIAAGEPIRLGFANEVPWSFPDEDGNPTGFVNAHTVGVLNAMGIDNIEPVVTDWSALIPALKAGRLDAITGGMYILGSRCENIAFSEPMAAVGDAFIVAPGNPKGINNYEDLKSTGAIFVTGAGYNTVEAAKREGVADANVMQVPGPTEILAAVKAGRADAGGVTYFTAVNLVKEAGGAIDISDVTKLPEWTQNWVGIGFRKEDQDFIDQFNAAQAGYIGTDAMLAAVAEFGYSKGTLPGDKTTEWVCANR